MGGRLSLIRRRETGWWRGRWGVLALALVLVPLGLTTACKKQEQKAVKAVKVNVRVWTAEKRSLRPYVEAIGTLNPHDIVTVSSELDGILEAIQVEEGTKIRRGQPIAEIRQMDYRLALEQSEALLKQSQANLENARLEYERKAALYREELVTRQQFDDITARLALAKADVERARAARQFASEKLAKATVYAPMDGVVKEKRVTAGDYVRNGSFLVAIIRTDLLKLAFSVSEKDVGTLRLGQDVSFAVDAFPGQAFPGRVRMIHPSLEEKTRSLLVEALVPNGDGRLKPGLFARVTLYTGPARETVVVPITALLYDGSTTKLFVVEGDRARERKVRLGRKYGEFMEIVEGLKAEEIVVTVGQNNLMEGALVHVAR